MKKIVVVNLKGGVGKSTISVALADILPNSQLIDLDHQGSLSIAYEFTGRHKPIDIKEASGDYLIFDTPPYLSEKLPEMLKDSNLVVIPTAIGQYDLLALKGIVDRVRKANAVAKTWIVFNRVPARSTKTLERTKQFFIDNYKDIKKAKQHLSFLTAYHTLPEKPIWGKARKEITALAKEMGIRI